MVPIKFTSPARIVAPSTTNTTHQTLHDRNHHYQTAAAWARHAPTEANRAGYAGPAAGAGAVDMERSCADCRVIQWLDGAVASVSTPAERGVASAGEYNVEWSY
jgi:hypothetical protein